MRRSVAAVALIHCEQDGQKRWLVRWNGTWRQYSLVGGHKRAGESFRQCLTREMQEELSLREGSGFIVTSEPANPARFTAWSESAREQTAYEMAAFNVQLAGESARHVIDGNSQTRWLTREEIRAGRCTDGQPVSAVVDLLLADAGM